VKSRLAAAAGHRGQKRPRRSVKPHPRSPSAEPDVRRKVGRQEPSPEEVQAWLAQTRLFKEHKPFGLSRADFEPAWSRVGTTDEERARWLLDFAARDLTALSAADWLTLRWDVFGFLYPPSGGPPPFYSDATPAGEPSCSENQVRIMHSWLRSGLECLSAGHFWFFPIAATSRLIVLGDRGLGTWSHEEGSPGEYTNIFSLMAYEALARKAQRFRVCAKCRRPFLARKRQAYCSKRCSQTVRTTKYRAAHRRKVNESRMRSYYANRGKAGRHLVRLVADDEVPAAVGRCTVELEQALLDHPPHEIRHVRGVDAVAEAPLEPVAVQERHVRRSARGRAVEFFSTISSRSRDQAPGSGGVLAVGLHQYGLYGGLLM
jgi:hypothetical protein